MTASKTARLGLMSPVGSDAFLTSDFSQTMGILDANPGVPVVANAAARPTAYTAAQHGSMVYQADLNLLWVWYQPNSGTTGFWQRVNSTGFLGQFSNSGSVSTSTTNYSVGPTVASGTITVPGGRSIMVLMGWDRLDNNYNKCMVSYWENNVKITDKLFYAAGSSDATAAMFYLQRNPAPVNALSLTVKMTIAAYNAAPSNGGGTSTMTGGVLTVWET